MDKLLRSLSIILLCFLKLSIVFATEKPNILFIYTDDQSHRTVSAYPESYDWVKTPNIDQLAKEGVRFTQGLIGSWCMASRASLLTGLQQHGIESMKCVDPYPSSTYDPKQCRFWPSVFRKEGYATAHIGKWHTGVDGGYGRDWDYQKIWNRPKYPNNAPNYYDNQLIETNGGEPVMTKGYTTDLYTNWAIDYIRGENRPKDKPWYLWLCYGAVHGPFTPADRHLTELNNIDLPLPKDLYPPRPGKPDYIDKMAFWEENADGVAVESNFRKATTDTGGRAPMAMKDMPGRPLKDWVRQYHQGVLAIDEGVGRLLKALLESGQDENTLVVFTSDQGFAWGQKGFKSKVAPYDSTIRAPLIFRLPKNQRTAKSTGSVVEAPVGGVDIPPTFFKWAGIDLPWKMHGHDLTPLLMDSKSKWKYPSLLTHTAKKYGSDTDKVPAKDDPALIHGPGIPWYVMLTKGHKKYIRTLIEGEIEELYDLKNDPDELNNLALNPNYRKELLAFRKEALKELKRTDAKMVNHLPQVAHP